MTFKKIILIKKNFEKWKVFTFPRKLLENYLTFKKLFTIKKINLITHDSFFVVFVGRNVIATPISKFKYWFVEVDSWV